MSPEAIGNESGQMEITPMHGSKEWDEAPWGTVSTPNSLKEGGTSKLADPRIAKYVDGTTPIKSKITLSCKE